MPTGIVDSVWYELDEIFAEWKIEWDVWQDTAGQVILGVRQDGTYAATVGGITLSIPRQVAKTFLVSRLIFALCVAFPGMKVLWTAHRTRTATNTFSGLRGFARRKAVARHIRSIRAANGEQEIAFTNGSVIMFGAREQGFGRGFDEVDIEVFDEAQILTEKALEDMVAATNQARHVHGALLFYMGTPPRPVDPGEVFLTRRDKAISSKPSGQVVGEQGDAVYIECSADDNVGEPGGPSLDDPEQLRKANPSFPHRTPPESIARLRENLPSDDAWRREGLGVHDKVFGARALIDDAAWKRGHVEIAPPAGVQAYGVKFSADGARVSLAGARRPDGGPTHVEVIKVSSTAAGTSWLADWLAERWRKASVIVIDGKAGVDQLVTALRKRGVPKRVIVTPTLSQVYEAHSGLLEAVKVGDLTHYGQTGLDDVVKAATKRPIGKDGGWGWQPIGDDIDVTPLEAVTYAHFGATTTKRKPTDGDERGRTSISSGRRAGVA
jgi:hypothetical protein